MGKAEIMTREIVRHELHEGQLPRHGVIFERENSIKERAVNMLAGLVNEQRELVKSGVFEPFRTNDWNKLQRAFTKSYLYEMIVQEAIGGGEYKNQELVGALFAELAYGHLAANLKRESVIIPSEGVMDINHTVKPEAEVTQHPFEQNSLMGIYVPDGFIVNKEGKITDLLEYTLSRSQEKYDRQYEGFLQAVRHDPYLFSDDVKMTYVVPSSCPYLKTKRDSRVKRLPFSHHDFGQFTRAVEKEIEDKRSPLAKRETIFQAEKAKQNNAFSRVGAYR